MISTSHLYGIGGILVACAVAIVVSHPDCRAWLATRLHKAATGKHASRLTADDSVYRWLRSMNRDLGTRRSVYTPPQRERVVPPCVEASTPPDWYVFEPFPGDPLPAGVITDGVFTDYFPGRDVPALAGEPDLAGRSPLASTSQGPVSEPASPAPDTAGRTANVNTGAGEPTTAQITAIFTAAQIKRLQALSLTDTSADPRELPDWSATYQWLDEAFDSTVQRLRLDMAAISALTGAAA